MNLSPAMQRYLDYIQQLEAQGTRLVEFPCPACAEGILAPAAAPCEVIDTLTDCPYCGTLFLMISESDRARGMLV